MKSSGRAVQLTRKYALKWELLYIQGKDIHTKQFLREVVPVV